MAAEAEQVRETEAAKETGSADRRLVAIGGLSGSGKSTLARAIAPYLGGPLGAVVLRTDVLRKQMLGVALTDRLDAAAYTLASSDKVYAEMMSEARSALEAGHAVILDAVFARESERRAVQDLSDELKVPFHGLWLEAPYNELVQRLDRRRGDASDATRAVLDLQRGYQLGDLTWARVATSGGIDDTLRRARALIEGP